MTLAAIQDVDLAWDSFGPDDGEVMLLISGLGAQMIRWTAPFCEALAARGYRVIRFDNRDSGLSTQFDAAPPPDFTALAADLRQGRMPKLPYTLGDMAADAIGLLDTLGIDRAHLVGRSMGGMIAQILACDYPDRVLSLTSIMSGTGNPALPSAAPEVLAMMTRPAPDPAHDLEGFLAQRLAFARRIAGTGHAFDEPTQRALLLEEMHRAYHPDGAARQLAAMATAGDRRARLASIKAPSLVIHGTDDPLIPPECGQDTAHSIPNAAYMPIKGMGHDLPPAFQPVIIEAICNLAQKGSASLSP